MKFIVANFPVWTAEKHLHRTGPATPCPHVPPSTFLRFPLSHRTGNGFVPAQQGPGWGCHLLQPHGDPRAPPGLVRPLIAMESGWAALPCSSPHPACSFLPTRPGWAWVHITCLKQIYWLGCLVFCAQGQIEPEIQGISKLKLHPVAGSGSCYNSEVKETVCCHKIKQHFSVLPLKIFKSNV